MLTAGTVASTETEIQDLQCLGTANTTKLAKPFTEHLP